MSNISHKIVILYGFLKTKVADVVFFAPFISILYLFGYWWSFGINIFEFIALSDVIAIALSKFTLFGIIIIVSYFISFVLLIPILNRITEFLRDKPIQDIKFEGCKVWIYFMLLIITLIFSVYYLLNSNIIGFWWLGFFFSISGLSLLGDSQILVKSLPDRGLRNSIIASSIVLIAFAPMFGIYNAESIKKGSSGVKLNNDNWDENIRYLGKAGDHFFFWAKKEDVSEGRTFIMNSSAVNRLSYGEKE